MSLDKSVFESDEGDIIAETPQKIQKRSLRKLKAVKKFNVFSTLETKSKKNVHHYLLSESYVIRNESPSVSKILNVENVNERYKRPYIFYEFKEVLNFTELYQPFNINIKMVGIYKQTHVNVHYLIEFKKSCAKIIPMKILIDFKTSNSYPVQEQAIEVYGFLNFCKIQAFPVFIVNFWSNINIDLNRYVDCLRQQKLYVPSCYKEIKSSIDEFKNFERNKNIEYSFEDIDESFLNKNVEDLEQICYEINQIMQISEDIFK